MPTSDIWSLMNMNRETVFKHFIHARRYLQNGFELDPRFHADNKLGLASLNQIITLDVHTGEAVHIA